MGFPEAASLQEFFDMNTLTHLILIEHEKRLNLTKEIIFERQKNQQLEHFIDEISNRTAFSENLSQVATPIPESPQIGAYPYYIRKIKIKNYKRKIKKYRKNVKISRSFKGRSIAAKHKPRLNGKFVKNH